jgi:hypothetical protein
MKQKMPTIERTSAGRGYVGVIGFVEYFLFHSLSIAAFIVSKDSENRSGRGEREERGVKEESGESGREEDGSVEGAK